VIKSNFFFSFWLFIAMLIALSFQFNGCIVAQELTPGQIVEIPFPNAELPPTLYTMMTGTPSEPVLSVRLPDDFDASKSFPLIVYVPGFHGGPKGGNIYNAQMIAGPTGWIAVSLPLFKESVDATEYANGITIGFKDFPTISRAYRIMLGKLFDLVPNIDREKSALVGFSNGALTISVLVTCNDEFILTHFKNFCLVDNGMFSLTDLHKKYARDCRYLLLVGDKEDFGRELKIRGCQLLQDSWKLLGVNLTYQILKDTGHEFYDRHMILVGKWLRNEPIDLK
jgi:hypothetical protein